MATMRQRHIVECIALPRAKANLVAWLEPHDAAKTPIFPKHWQRMFNAVKKPAGFGTPNAKHPHLKPWPVDVMRHTAVSNIALLADEGRAAGWAGHSIDALHRNYRGQNSAPPRDAGGRGPPILRALLG